MVRTTTVLQKKFSNNRAVSRFLVRIMAFIGINIIYDADGGELTPGNGYGGQKYEKRNKK